MEQNKQSSKDLNVSYLFDIYSDDFTELKRKTLNIFNCFFALSIIPALISRWFQEEWLIVIIDLLTIALLIISSICLNKNYKVSLLISVILIPILGFTLAFSDELPLSGIFAVLCLMLGIFLMVLTKYQIIYGTIYSSLLLFLFISKIDNPLLSYPTLMIIISFMACMFLFSKFVEKQNQIILENKAMLNSNIENLNKINHELASKNEDLRTFSHIMSHDLKAPLRTMISFLGILKKKITLSTEKEKEYFSFIEKSSIEMTNLIDELMIIQKVDQESIDFEEVSLNNLLNEIKENHKIQIVEDKLKFAIDEIPNVSGNYAFLKILFNNMVSNSIKYQPKDFNHITEIKISGSIENEKIIIYFSDNGIGIDSQYINQLFEPFKRFHSSSEYTGSGLGMSICRKIMKKHKGEISLYKTSNEGSIFKLCFNVNPTANRVDGREP